MVFPIEIPTRISPPIIVGESCGEKRKETHTNHEVPNHWTVPLFQFAFLKETILTPLSADDCRSPLLLQDRHPRRPRCRCPRLRRRGLCQDLQPAQTCTFCTAPPIPLEAVQAL